MVDKVKNLVGGTCTVFMNDLRIATNVLKPDGTVSYVSIGETSFEELQAALSSALISPG